jgi:hypothetical protein
MPSVTWINPEYTGNVAGLIPIGGLMVTSNLIVPPGFSLKLVLENLADANCFVNGTGPRLD